MTAWHERNGYTLVEVVTALLLSTILLAAAVPGIGAIVAHHRLSAATRQLAFEIARARMEAVGKNAHVRLAVLGPREYRREISRDGVSFEPAGGVVVLPEGFRIIVWDQGNLPRFDRQGLAPATSVLTIIGPRGGKTVVTNVLGRTRIS